MKPITNEPDALQQAYFDKVIPELLEHATNHKRMKVICILQNAWGNSTLPYIFVPNPQNKSAKTIRKTVGENVVFHFCNTTGVITNTAAGKAPIDTTHFKEVIKRLTHYDMILVCGQQARKAVQGEIKALVALKKPIVYMPHPASRSLSNLQIAEVTKMINAIKETLL